MSDSVNLSTFPRNEDEALAMLDVKNQDLNGKSVDELAEIYYSA